MNEEWYRFKEQNTEWPRIRDVGTSENPDYLMTMHGMFWRFPGNFTPGSAAGIRPRSAYLKIIGDFARWNDQIVFGCDDAAQKEFLNLRSAKGGIEGAGQSNSNLWFSCFDTPDLLGPATASGAVWLNDDVAANTPSEPFLFAGWGKRMAWIHNAGNADAEFAFEVDKNGDGNWEASQSLVVPAGKSATQVFRASERGEWIRVRTGIKTQASVNFNYGNPDKRQTTPDQMFEGLSVINENPLLGGLLYALGNDRRSLGIAARRYSADGTFEETGYYELDDKMNLQRKEDPEAHQLIQSTFAIPENVIYPDASSVLITDDSGRRWRLPLGDEKYTHLTNKASLRICREVVTERDLFNCHGTFYELPAENADGYAKIRPIASHSFRINDYASYRGLLILSGIHPAINSNNPHIIKSVDGDAAVWVGTIDDLWKMGKPTGKGGPWREATVKAGEPSDPYLFGFYDKRSLQLSHKASEPVTFAIQLEPIGHGPWMTWKEVTVAPGETYNLVFPDEIEARWIRFVSNRDCAATAWLEYR